VGSSAISGAGAISMQVLVLKDRHKCTNARRTRLACARAGGAARVSDKVSGPERSPSTVYITKQTNNDLRKMSKRTL
jgi:hypothetical protein